MPKINTYTDNAIIEDVDALLTYDPAGNGATKLTTFARIASWISAKLSALTKKTSIASTDQILMVDGAASPVVTKRIDYNVLAKAIIEQYASSSLAGANQSVKTAIDALNSKTDLTSQITMATGFTIKTGGLMKSGNVYVLSVVIEAEEALATGNQVILGNLSASVAPSAPINFMCSMSISEWRQSSSPYCFIQSSIAVVPDFEGCKFVKICTSWVK